jgi:hypothetical protein
MFTPDSECCVGVLIKYLKITNLLRFGVKAINLPLLTFTADKTSGQSLRLERETDRNLLRFLLWQREKFDRVNTIEILANVSDW